MEMKFGIMILMENNTVTGFQLLWISLITFMFQEVLVGIFLWRN